MNMYPVCQILEEIKAVIDTPEKWTQGTQARDKEGNKVALFNSDAVSFCLIGAMVKVKFNTNFPDDEVGYRHYAYGQAEKLLMAESGGRAWFNDKATTSHEDVIRLIDSCILKAKE